MPDTYITAAMLSLVGAELRRVTAFPITDSDIRRWAIAVHYPEPAPRLFWDEEYARGTIHGGIVAPEDFNPFAWVTQTGAHADTTRETGEYAGPEQLLGAVTPATTAMVNGGIDVEYGVRMRPGDVITSRTTLGEYREREGRLGVMLFTTMIDSWTDQRGQTVKTSRSTLIRY